MVDSFNERLDIKRNDFSEENLEIFGSSIMVYFDLELEVKEVEINFDTTRAFANSSATSITHFKNIEKSLTFSLSPKKPGFPLDWVFFQLPSSINKYMTIITGSFVGLVGTSVFKSSA